MRKTAPKKGKTGATTVAALLQFGSGMGAYVSRMPHWEYTEQECDQIASASMDVLGEMSSKKAKALLAWANKVTPYLTLAGVLVATTFPRIKATRTVLAERRQQEQERKRNAVPVVQSSHGFGGAPSAIDIARSANGVVGEGRESNGAAGGDGVANRSRGVGFDSE
jgi:hypothetical protein